LLPIIRKKEKPVFAAHYDKPLPTAPAVTKVLIFIKVALLPSGGRAHRKFKESEELPCGLRITLMRQLADPDIFATPAADPRTP